MPLYKERELHDLAEKARLDQSAQQNLRKAMTDSTKSLSKYIFLSHSHHDRKFVEDAQEFFALFGVDLYIDWLDPEMPGLTSPKTAANLKIKIRNCHRFVVLASNNAGSSKWVPWELGYADSVKTMKNIAIFGLADNSGSWIGNEYIGIYPRITKATNDMPCVFDAGSTENGIALAKWMNRP